MRPNAETSNEFADIHIQVRELQQLFNSLDPTPFPDRDLDERAEEFIIGWAKEHPSHLPLRLLIKLEKDGSAAKLAQDAQKFALKELPKEEPAPIVFSRPLSMAPRQGEG